MKEVLIISLLVCGAVAEAPASYPPSGWRPSGPSFDLPQRGQQPLDPRIPLPPGTSYGVPDDDVSVQGLPPPQEQQPLFQASPISGQQYVGPAFNTDLKNLDQRFKQSQYQQQQERYREYQRQKQLEAAQAVPNGNRLPVPQNPRQFAPRPSSTTTTEAATTLVASTTEISLNQGEVLNDDVKSDELKNGKTTVEITKQNVQEYPAEFFLNSLAQIQLQPQFVPLQPLSGAYLQPQGKSQKQVAGFDAAIHFAALPSVLAQQNLQPQNPVLLTQSRQQAVLIRQSYQPQIQTQLQPEPVVIQAPAQFQPNFYAQPNPDAVAVQPAQYPVNPFQPNPDAVSIQPQYQPQPAFQPNPDAVSIQPQYQPQPQVFTQIQAQRVIYQPQPNQAVQLQSIPSPKKESEDTDIEDREEQQNQNNQRLYNQPIVVQPQPQYQQFPAQLVQNQDQVQLQPQAQYQPEIQYLQPQNQYLQPQFQLNQPQNQYGLPQVQYNQPQGQVSQPQVQFNQPQGQIGQPQGQFIRPEAQFLQPQTQYQPQPQFLQTQLLQSQNQYLEPQGQFTQEGQNSLQSGLDINQEGNDLDQDEEKESEQEGVTTVASAFGTRTQPRLQPKYGVPFPVPRVQANPSTTDSPAVEEVTEDGPAVAQATAVSNGERRKSARLRSRRLRPVYAVDRSGRLVFAEAQ